MTTPDTRSTDEADAERYAVNNEQATLNIERIKDAVLFGCAHVRAELDAEVSMLRKALAEYAQCGAFDCEASRECRDLAACIAEEKNEQH